MEGRADIAREQAARFLQQAGDYHLGNLPTESRHPLTYELAHLACRDLPRALHTLKQIDCSSIEGVLSKSPGVAELSTRMLGCMANGQRVFIYGCDATGRLSVSLEYLSR